MFDVPNPHGIKVLARLPVGWLPFAWTHYLSI